MSPLKRIAKMKKLRRCTPVQRRQLQKARLARRFRLSQAPPKPRYTLRKTDVVEAMKDTGGILRAIAMNLGVSRELLKRTMERPDWADIRELWEQAREEGIDEAELTILHAIRQRLDLGTAAATARWFLSKVQRERFGDDKTLTVEGGDHPIKTQSVNVNLDSLDLPLEVRRVLLHAIDVKDEEERRKMLGPVQSSLTPEVSDAGEHRIEEGGL
jgi:hypothetical protein